MLTYEQNKRVLSYNENCIFVLQIKEMYRKVKYIGTSFVWLAVLVIIAHSVIPHHHHSDAITCEHECAHENTLKVIKQLSVLDQPQAHTQCHATHDQQHCHACHFSTDATTVLSKLTIDNTICIVSLMMDLLQPKEKMTYVDSWSNHYSFEFYFHASLRGPPSLG